HLAGRTGADRGGVAAEVRGPARPAAGLLGRLPGDPRHNRILAGPPQPAARPAAVHAHGRRLLGAQPIVAMNVLTGLLATMLVAAAPPADKPAAPEHSADADVTFTVP